MANIALRQPTDTVAEAELHAYNAAFYELGLRWHWDSAIYDELRTIPAGRARVRAYLESHQAHLLKAYDAEFLADAIELKRTQFQEVLGTSGRGNCKHFSWADARMNEVGH